MKIYKMYFSVIIKIFSDCKINCLYIYIFKLKINVDKYSLLNKIIIIYYILIFYLIL